MKKLILGTAILAAAGGMSTSANAALASNATLSIDPFVLGGYYGDLVVGGSYFAMDNDGSGAWEKKERVGLTAGTDGGINLGATQGVGAIDSPWSFFNAIGNHTQAGTLSVSGANTINMTGWNVFWNGGNIDMGTGADAVVACNDGNACAAGSAYTLDYNAVVPSGGFAGVAYLLHLEGVVGTGAVSAVPVPAAVWLFGSGLLGLVGVARRKAA